MEEFEADLLLDPHNVPAANNAAICLLQLGRLTEAIEKLVSPFMRTRFSFSFLGKERHEKREWSMYRGRKRGAFRADVEFLFFSPSTLVIVGPLSCLVHRRRHCVAM